MSIPRNIAQCWIGPSPIPEREKAWVAQMAATNPGWKHTLHGNEALERYGQDPYLRELMSRDEAWAFVSDRLRVLLLRDEGGVYLDADCKPLRPLDTLKHVWDAPHVEFVLGLRNPFKHGVALSRGVTLADNTFLASAPNGRVINKLASAWTPRSPLINGNLTGKVIMTCTGVDTVWLPFQYFYADAALPESIVLHDAHNKGSWVDPAIRKANAQVLITA